MELPAWLSALASLTSLCFHVRSLLTGVDNAGRLAGLAQLRRLAMWVRDQGDDPLPAGLHGLPQLTALELHMWGEQGLPGNPAARSLSRLSALHTLRWHPTGIRAGAMPACILKLRSLRSLALDQVAPESLHPGPCWAGLTQLGCEFSPCTATLPPVLALATALEHLKLDGLAELDAAAPALLARLPALRRLGLPVINLMPCAAEVLFALGQACPHLSLYDWRSHNDYDRDDEWKQLG